VLLSNHPDPGVAGVKDLIGCKKKQRPDPYEQGGEREKLIEGGKETLNSRCFKVGEAWGEEARRDEAKRGGSAERNKSHMGRGALLTSISVRTGPNTESGVCVKEMTAVTELGGRQSSLFALKHLQKELKGGARKPGRPWGNGAGGRETSQDNKPDTHADWAMGGEFPLRRHLRLREAKQAIPGQSISKRQKSRRPESL